MAHTGITMDAPKKISVQLPTSLPTSKERHDQWIKLPPATDLHPCTTGDGCVGCGLNHKTEDCPFIFHGKHKDSGVMELYYPTFYKLNDGEIIAYLTLLTTHGFLKSASQEDVDEIIRIISRKRRGFQNNKDDPDRDNYRRTKARYGDYPTPPDTNRHNQSKGYNNRQERYYNERKVDNRPAWKAPNDNQPGN